MKVADLMVTDLAVVNQDISIREAVIQLADARVHAMPVVDRRDRLVGVLSSSDIVQPTADSEPVLASTAIGIAGTASFRAS